MDSQLENECSRRIHRPKNISGEISVARLDKLIWFLYLPDMENLVDP